MYDASVTETYAICMYKFAMPSSADTAMVKIWIFLWSHAAALNEQAGTTKFIVLCPLPGPSPRSAAEASVS
ncbi:hypothetical protein E3T34_08495 [Cryobacterium sp. TMT1-62]|uniref:hypothetical protein n=1 Tax=unclassified Cryobacterium TaxID=2649013 RepID=UPI00106D002F|nr:MULTISPECIES: hypothetical protein [unclassified Cryobacterium]TFB55483.1 hypothetical protein E3N94_09525 [Cryobacterium sp. Sr3]TFC64055.1 hypothetical protein E3O54_15195 [Cryobacterium sp. TMT2-4]TFD32478.1 hypothetical protein E3T34_08495 [Cryobacterium sp. TMT1-62]